MIVIDTRIQYAHNNAVAGDACSMDGADVKNSAAVRHALKLICGVEGRCCFLIRVHHRIRRYRINARHFGDCSGGRYRNGHGKTGEYRGILMFDGIRISKLYLTARCGALHCIALRKRIGICFAIGVRQYSWQFL